ncbi:MAG: NAD(P)-binding protein [Candidatus Lokiarchaeota archaeon]|nr:NAD(P)-binding protein [Candidatus Lokiarchaeota archaeon]MBD3338715.1 NAD(P)-binding protein [Candidatus Lokiarchaeota archaeon]
MKAIIIGSGISGLTAGAYLVDNGWEVKIYEQYKKIGGVTSQIEKDGYKWDLGQMLVEGFGPEEPAGLVFSELGVLKDIKTVRTERAYVFPDFALYKPDKYEDVFWRRERFKELFPEDSEGIDKYYEFYKKMFGLATLARKSEQAKGLKSVILKIKMIFKLFLVISKKNWDAQKIMGYFFKSEKLRSVFLTILADFVTPPTQFIGLGVPFINPEPAFDEDIPLKLSRNLEHPSYRYILGGMGTMVKAMVKKIEKGEGTLKPSKTVTKIIIEGGIAKGIVCEDGDSEEADLIIATGGAKEMLLDLIDSTYLSEEFIDRVKKLPLMESVFMVHLGIDFDPHQYQKLATVYYYGTYNVDEAIKECREGKYHEGKDGFVVFIPTYYSPELAPKGHHAMTIYTIAPNVLENGSWKQNKEDLADNLLKEAEKIIPGLREHTKVRVILTPDDFKDIIRVKHHAFGGMAPIMGQKTVPHEIPIENLLFIGSQSEGSGGLCKIITEAAGATKKIIESYK